MAATAAAAKEEGVQAAKQGAEKRWRCKFAGGCDKYRQNGTRYCVKHGGSRACSFPGSTATSRKGGQGKYCIRHGGGSRCTYPGCQTAARGRTGYCYRHRKGNIEDFNNEAYFKGIAYSLPEDSLVTRLLQDIDYQSASEPSTDSSSTTASVSSTTESLPIFPRSQVGRSQFSYPGFDKPIIYHL